MNGELTVKNFFDSTSVQHFIYFLVAPEIFINPKDNTMVEGEDVAFSCLVGGSPPPSVSWTRNGVELNFTANHRVSLFSTNNNHSLAITNVQESDAGQYRCVASNTVGRSTSFSATLTVPCEYFS